MRTAIVGSGAMGTLFGAYLARGGHQVWMVGRRPPVAAALARDGLRVEGLAQLAAAVAGATADPAQVPEVDLALVLVKAGDTAAAAQAIARFPVPPPTVLTLQNGAGNVEALAERLGAERVLAGTSALGATLLGVGRVRQAGAGETVIGRPGGGPDARLEGIARAFTQAGLPTRVSEHVEQDLWRKLVVNCALNAVGALARVPNGVVGEDPGLARVAEAAAREAAALGQAQGLDTDPEAMVHLVRQVCRQTAGNYNSMLQDVLAGRPTEVGAINGYVAGQAEARGLPAPANRLLADLVRGIEGNYDRQVKGEWGQAC